MRIFLNSRRSECAVAAPERRQKREEWLQALERLFQQMEEWLRQVDAEKVLRVDRRSIQLRDELGTYPASALTFDLYGSKAEAIPVAWDVAAPMAVSISLGGAPEGRVDLTDGGRKYKLFRRGGNWMIVDERDAMAPSPVPFDRQAFETALVDLLR